MRNLFFFLFIVSCTICSAQNESAPPPPPAPIIETNKSNDDSCYAVQKTDTIWKTTCHSIEQPADPGGDTALYGFLRRTTHYPQIALENGVQGRVFITFIVDKTGEVTEVEVYKGASIPNEIKEEYAGNKKKISAYNDVAKTLDKEAVRVVSMMPAWKPGKQDNKPVKVRYVLPINFKLK